VSQREIANKIYENLLFWGLKSI